MTSQFAAQLHRLRCGLSTVEFVYMSHDRWPLPRRPAQMALAAHTLSRLNISVLDSSFNPPTLAHLALANSPFPIAFRAVPSAGDSFHAKLLLLSVRNVDKQLKPSDATYEQRLEMMVLLAKDLLSDGVTTSEDDTHHLGEPDSTNVAVAIIDEPTFVGKSRRLLDSLRERVSQLPVSSSLEAGPTPLPPSMPLVRPNLTFLVGMDTLDRLFSPRYYPSEEEMRSSLRRFLSSDGDDSRVICARRSGTKEDTASVEARCVDAAKEFIDSQRITLVDIDERFAAYSSSDVRERVSSDQDDASWSALVTQRIADFIMKNGLYTQLIA